MLVDWGGLLEISLAVSGSCFCYGFIKTFDANSQCGSNCLSAKKCLIASKSNREDVQLCIARYHLPILLLINSSDKIIFGKWNPEIKIK